MDDARSSGPPQRLEILDARDGALMGLWRNVLVASLQAMPDLDQLKRIHAVQRDIAPRFPKGFAALVILPSLSPNLLSREVRAMAEQIIGSAAPEVLGLAQVIERGGFVSAAIRSVATGIMLVSRPRWPTRIFTGVEPAAAWVSSWVEGESRPGATRKLTEAIRADARLEHQSG